MFNRKLWALGSLAYVPTGHRMTITMKLARATIGALALAWVAFACMPGGDGGTDPANGTGPTSGWSVTGTTSDLSPTIPQSGVDSITVTVTRVGGFTGAVTLTPVVAAQGGITATIDNIVTTANVTTARLIISIGPSFPAGAQSVNVGVTPVGGVAPVTVALSINIVVKPGVYVVTASTLSVGQGSNAVATVTLRRTNYTAPVPMSLSTTQPGLTATFSPNPATDSTTTMTLQADASVPLGTYNVGARANDGITGFQATAPLTLTVTAPGSIALSLGLNPLIVRLGTSTPTGVTIARTNFTGLVTFAFSGLPTGLTATTLPNPTLANTASVAFYAIGNPPVGSYPITITASGQGIPNANIVQMVTVSP